MWSSGKRICWSKHDSCACLASHGWVAVGYAQWSILFNASRWILRLQNPRGRGNEIYLVFIRYMLTCARTTSFIMFTMGMHIHIQTLSIWWRRRILKVLLPTFLDAQSPTSHIFPPCSPTSHILYCPPAYIQTHDNTNIYDHILYRYLLFVIAQIWHQTR